MINKEEAVKFDADKLRFDLIPSSVLEELAMVYTIGSIKYADENWRKGLSYKRLFGAMMRHAWTWFRGEKYDADGQHHLSSVIWCAAALIEHEILKPELDDRFEAKEGKIQNWWSVRRVEMAKSLQLIKEKYKKNDNSTSIQSR